MVRGNRGVPELQLGPLPLPLCFSRAHSRRSGSEVWFTWAVAPRTEVQGLGVDLEISPLNDETLWEDFFSVSERSRLMEHAFAWKLPDPLRVGWCFKEAAWKALRGEGPSEFLEWEVLSLTEHLGAEGRETQASVRTRMDRGQRSGAEVFVQAKSGVTEVKDTNGIRFIARWALAWQPRV